MLHNIVMYNSEKLTTKNIMNAIMCPFINNIYNILCSFGSPVAVNFPKIYNRCSEHLSKINIVNYISVFVRWSNVHYMTHTHPDIYTTIFFIPHNHIYAYEFATLCGIAGNKLTDGRRITIIVNTHTFLQEGKISPNTLTHKLAKRKQFYFNEFAYNIIPYYIQPYNYTEIAENYVHNVAGYLLDNNICILLNNNAHLWGIILRFLL